jgi:hypothetical protein
MDLVPIEIALDYHLTSINRCAEMDSLPMEISSDPSVEKRCLAVLRNSESAIDRSPITCMLLGSTEPLKDAASSDFQAAGKLGSREYNITLESALQKAYRH